MKPKRFYPQRKRDLSHRFQYIDPEDGLIVHRCVCGAKWTCYVYAGERFRCPKCKKWFYFTSVIRIYEEKKPLLTTP